MTVLCLTLIFWTVTNSRDESIRNKSGKIFLGAAAWIGLQALFSLIGIYTENLMALPPKIFVFGIFPTLLLILWLFISRSGRKFIDSLPIEKITYIHIVRVPVEFGLLWLSIEKLIPNILTFEGWNFDIFMGLTAPVVIYFGFVRQKINSKVLLAWNIIGVPVLLFVVVLGVLSAPFPMQQLAFDQPNYGLLYFPFSWLPTFIVPLVLLGHLISIRQLIMAKSEVDK